MREQILQRTEHFLHALIGAFEQGNAFLSGRLDIRGSCRALLTARRSGLQLRQHARADQRLIGLGVKHVAAAEHVLFEQLEDDQLDLDLHTQATAGVEEVFAEQGGAERVALVVQLLADHRIEARGEMAQRNSVSAHHLGYHGVQRHGFFQLVVLYQAQAVERHRVERGLRLADFVLIEIGEGLEHLLQKTTLDVLALQTQVTHGLEEGILLGITGRPIRHLEEGIVGIVEQALQTLLELLRRFVTHLNQRHGQSSYRRSWRLLSGGLGQGHHIRVGLHSSLPQTARTRASWSAQRQPSVVRNVKGLASIMKKVKPL